MTQEKEKALEIQKTTGLKPRHFADFIRVAQVVDNPGGGVAGKDVDVDWQEFDIPPEVEENIKSLGQKYRYASPHVHMEKIWEQLIPETRRWLIDNKDDLWRIEEAFPALDED